MSLGSRILYPSRTNLIEQGYVKVRLRNIMWVICYHISNIFFLSSYMLGSVIEIQNPFSNILFDNKCYAQGYPI